MLNAAREDCHQSFLSSKATNKNRYLKGDVKATEEYIFDNQMSDADNIVSMFYENNFRVISVQKKTKVGADGLMIYVAYLMTTHSDDNFVVQSENVSIITGMSNVGWETDMKDKAPSFLKNNIFHHGKLSRAYLVDIRNALIIIDEIDSGDKEYQKLHRKLKDAGLLNVDHMVSHNIRFLFISATMIKELHDLHRWGPDLYGQYKMTIPPEYIGHNDFLEKGIIQEFFPLNTNDNADKWVKEDIINHYGTDYRVHLVRLNGKSCNFVQNACIKEGVAFETHTSSDRLAPEILKGYFEGTLTGHMVLGIKCFYRRATLIPNLWKLRVGAVHELFTEKVDNNVQIQGLVGRMTGYWQRDIENGHKTGPYRTSVKAIEEYIKAYDDPLGEVSYRSSGFTKTSKGKVSANPTMLSVKNIANLKGIELPEINEDSNYDVTEPFEHLERLRDQMKSRIPCGKCTHYTRKDTLEFHYRGNIKKLHYYNTKKEFKTKDIFGGINNKIESTNIVCRMMPVIHNDKVKWVGIYLKAAYKQI